MINRERNLTSLFPVAPTLPRRAPVVDRKEPPVETTKSVMWNFFIEYLESSSIHGFYHLAVPKRTPLEYLIWLSLLGVGVAGAYVIGSTTLMRYQENPTVISMEKNYQDWNTTFPSMSICPIETYHPGKLAALVDQYSDEKTREAVREIMIFLVDDGNYENLTQELLELAPYFPIKPEQYVEYVFKIGLDFEYMSHISNGGTFNLTQTWSELGTCYVYNSVVSIYSNYQYWNNNRWDISYNHDILHGNPLDGEIFAEVTDMSALVKVHIHGYNDVPDIMSRPHFLHLKEYIEMDMSIWSISSTPETRSLSVKQRRCRFMDESDLFISPTYSYTMCRMQCRAKKATELCGCAPHYLRYNPRNFNWPRCNITGYACLKQHSEILSKLRDMKTEEKVKCKCMAPCDDLAFIGAKENTMSWFLSPLFKLGVTNYPRMRLKRDILFGLTDLFVSIGGTAGLFLGCSVLSFVEIFYFFTLRLFWFLYDRRKQRS